MLDFDVSLIAYLRDDAPVEIRTTAGALREAMQARQGGPEELSTQQAARFIGRTSKWWRQHAPRVALFWAALPATDPAKTSWAEAHPRDPREGAYRVRGDELVDAGGGEEADDENAQVGRWRLLNPAARAYYASLFGGGEKRPTPSRSVRRGPRKTTPGRGGR